MAATRVPHKVKEAITDEEIIACYPVLKDLRPKINSEKEFLERVRFQQKEGFHLLYIEDKINDEPEVRPVSILGYTIAHNLIDTHVMLFIDVSTLPSAKRKGYAGALTDRGIEIAREEKCEKVALVSRYPNTDAHRLYMRKGFRMTGHHFAHDLD